MDSSSKGFWQVIFFILKQLKSVEYHLKIRTVISFALILIGMCINVSTPILLRNLIKSFEFTKDLNAQSFIMILLFAYGVIWTSGQVVLQLRELVIVRVISRVIKMISLETVSHLLTLSMRFHAFKQTGSIITAIKQTQTAIPRIFWGFLFAIFPIFIEVCFASILITSSYGLTYGTILLTLFTSYVAFTIYSSRKILEKGASFNRKRQFEMGKVADVMLNIETVKYFGNVNFETSRCNEVLKVSEDAEFEFYYVLEQAHLFQGLIIGLGLMTTILISGFNVISGKFAVSDFVMINGYILQFVTPFMAMSKHIREVRQGVTDMQGSLKILDLEPEFIGLKDGIEVEKNNEIEVEFKNVEFGYFKDLPILKNINFKILAHKMTAIVGATGVGKSTITKMLFRFYDTIDGEILINDINLKKYNIESVIDCFGVVPQGAGMLNETLYYNLTYGKRDATNDEIWEALKIAQLDSFVKNLPHGLETKVGESGLRLSGGERQRLAIARAILKKPKLFIFDEATSALDTSTEKAIQKSLTQISAKVTTLVIAHRLTTIVGADQIVVLDGGTVVETGSHKELLKKGGKYAKLWNEQFIGKEANEDGNVNDEE